MTQNVSNADIEQNLTNAERSLLETLLNPENRMKSVTDICKLAKCSRSTYYDAFATPEFVGAYNARSTDIVKQSVAPVLNTFVREALRGSFQHGKVLLEMAGLYTEKKELKAIIYNPFSGLTEDELRRLANS